MFKGKLRWEIVCWLSVIVLLSYMDRVNFSMAAPILIEELGLSATQLGVALSGFTFGYFIFNFLGGFLAQKHSSRKILVGILCLWSVMTFATGMATGFMMLVAVRILFGAFEGPMAPAITKVVNAWALPKEKGKVTGMWIGAMPAGVIVGNVLSGYVISNYGWRSIFYIFGAGGVLLGIAMWRLLRDTPGEHPKISKEEQELIESQNEAAVVKTGGGSTIGQLLRDPYLYLLSIVYFGFIINAWAAQTWLPTYFVKARGSDLMTSSVFSSVPWVVAFIGCLTLGWLSDSTKGWRAPWLMIALLAIVPSTAFAVHTPSIYGCLAGFSVALYFSFGIASVAWAYVMDTYPAADVPKVSGIMLSAGSFAGVVAPLLIGIILDKTGEFKHAYYAFSAIAAFCAFLCIFLIKKEVRARAQKALAAAPAAVAGAAGHEG